MNELLRISVLIGTVVIPLRYARRPSLALTVFLGLAVLYLLMLRYTLLRGAL